MTIAHNFRGLLKRAAFGPVYYPQNVTVGLCDPQAEIDVWLHGLDESVNVTYCHIMASSAPLTIGISCQQTMAAALGRGKGLSLRFQKHGGEQALLGEIALDYYRAVPIGERQLCLFRVSGYRNYCLPWLRLWAHHQQYRKTYRPDKNPDVPITLLEARAMIVFFLCPRPVNLVTVEEGDRGNMFPINLMGSLGDGYFGFGLNSHRMSAPLVNRVRRVVFSSIPFEQVSVVARMGANHRKSSIAWKDLPFRVIRPKSIGAPVPKFAVRAREMEVEDAYPLGSHTLFVAKIVSEEQLAYKPQFFDMHGLYFARSGDKASVKLRDGTAAFPRGPGATPRVV